MTTRLEPPNHSGSREHARELVTSLADDLTGISVVLDCTGVTVATPSFLDEIIRVVLVARGAAGLEVVTRIARVAMLAERAAANRGVADRLTVARAA